MSSPAKGTYQKKNGPKKNDLDVKPEKPTRKRKKPEEGEEKKERRGRRKSNPEEAPEKKRRKSKKQEQQEEDRKLEELSNLLEEELEEDREDNAKSNHDEDESEEVLSSGNLGFLSGNNSGHAAPPNPNLPPPVPLTNIIPYLPKKMHELDPYQFSILCEFLLDDLIKDFTMEVILELHKKTKLASACLNCESTRDGVGLIAKPGLDIFGRDVKMNNNESFECPFCMRVVVSSRFAPHLEKCLGLGRNSSRIATRKLTTPSTTEDDDYDNLDTKDSLWQEREKRSGGRRKSDGEPRKGRGAKKPRSVLTMDAIKRKPKPEVVSILQQICATVIPANGRLCTKDKLTCVAHSDLQRHETRVNALGPNYQSVMLSEDGYIKKEVAREASPIDSHDSPSASPALSTQDQEESSEALDL